MASATRTGLPMRRQSSLTMSDPHGTVAGPMRERVLITGIGCVSTFGVGARAFFDALLAGASGIAPVSRFDTSRCRSHHAAELRDFNPAASIAPLKLRRMDEV